MGKTAVEIRVVEGLKNYLSESAYDSNKRNLGRGYIFNNGATSEEQYIQAHLAAIRPLEESTPFAVSQISVHNFSTERAYIFGVENLTTAVATRRIALWELDRKIGDIQWKGFITLTLSSATAHTVRDFKMDVKRESTGTVSVSGTAVTGSGTSFNANKVAIGARIGFGSTDPTQITQWFRVTGKSSDTALTINTSAGTIPSNTPYVIQEFRPIYTATNATLTNGGIHYVKGVSIEDFVIGGTTIPLATTLDDQKAVYWIKDASTQTNTIACGCACDFDTATPTNLDCYVLDLPLAGNYKIYKYNLRAALTVASGASVSGFVFATGNQAITGTGSQNANLCIATTNHGAGAGIKSLYCVSTTRVMRIPVSAVVSLSTTFISDNIAEITPGGVNTYVATSAMSTIEYMPSIDSFVIGSAATFSYVTQYVSSGQQFQKMFGRQFLYLEQSTKDNGAPTIFNNSATSFAFTDAGANRIFAVKQGTTQSLNQIYVMAFGCDRDYAEQSNGRLITPKISVPNCYKFDKAYVDAITFIGSNTLGKTTEPYRLYARSTNIDTDMTTGRLLLNKLNDLSGFAGSSEIQFAIESRVIGETCLPPRILGVTVLYEDNNTDSHFQPVADLSDKTNKRFAWRISQSFGDDIPTLRVRLYNAVTNGLLVDDDSLTPTGTRERSADGTTWIAYDIFDKQNDTDYIRYTPSSLADNIQVGALLTLL